MHGAGGPGRGVLVAVGIIVSLLVGTSTDTAAASVAPPSVAPVVDRGAAGRSSSGLPAVAAVEQPSWGPAQETASYVAGVYQDLFGRDPDPAGMSLWQGGLLNGLPRASVANAITSSTEYRSHLIADAYQRFLGRGPDGGGLQTWLGAMSAGWTIEQIQSGFIESDEYYARAGSAPAGWVALLYTDVLKRSAAPSEVAGWVDVLHRGGSRSQVAMGFLLSTENLTTVVDGYYGDLLGRHIDPSGARTWVSLIQGGARDEEIIGGIIASAEYWRTTAQASRIVLSPSLSTVRSGAAQTYRADAYDTSGTFIRDIGYRTTLRVDGSVAACSGTSCTVPTVGEHAVQGVSALVGGAAVLRVVPAGLDHLALSPATAAIASGASVHYAVQGLDAAGGSLGDLTFAATFTADAAPDACAGAVCSPLTPGTRAVTANVLGATGTASIEVTQPGPPGARAFTWESRDAYDTYGLRVVDASSLTQFEVDTHWAKIDAGDDYSVALKTDGTLWTWGHNAYGQLGTGDTEPRTVPTQVGADHDWAQVSASGAGGAALKTDGTMWTWGYGGPHAPTQVVGPGGTWTSVARDDGHTLAVRADGTMWAWGWGSRGELGIGVVDRVEVPTQVGTDHDWATVDVAEHHSFGIRTDGSLWAWGENFPGQLGIGGTTNVATPVRVGTGTWVSVTAAASSTVAIATDGSLWTWGSNTNGQLGDGTYDQRDVPTLVAPAGGAAWVSVDVGDAWGLGTRSDGTLWVWGGGYQQPWGPVPPGRLRPTRIGSGSRWTDVTAGGGMGFLERGVALGG